ncbi:MAG TPA: hypothetical protein VFC46_17980 [Humisphaera sp.]|nr:hypothetical protein [Humisphaera sp.]
MRGERNFTQSQCVKAERHREIARRAFDAYDRFISGGAPIEECLREIVTSARCDGMYVGGSAGGTLLNILAWDHELARDAIRDLLRNGDRSARFVAIGALERPRILMSDFVEEILRSGLSDGLLDIRKHAACKICELGVTSLLPHLIRMRQELTDPDDQYWVDLYIDLTRDGYSYAGPSLENVRKSDGTVSREWMCGMRVRCEYNGIGHCIGGGVRLAEMETSGPAAVAQKIRDKWLAECRS